MISLPRILVKRVSYGDEIINGNPYYNVDIDYYMMLGKNLPSSIRRSNKGTLNVLVAQVKDKQILLESERSRDQGAYIYNRFTQGRRQEKYAQAFNAKDYRIHPADRRKLLVENNVSIIPFNVNTGERGIFKIPEHERFSFLAYVFVPFIEKDGHHAFGAPTVELVMENGKMIKNATTYLPSKVNQSAPRSRSQADRRTTSEQRTVINSTILDHTIIQKLKNLKFIAKTETIKERESYVGDIFFSRDSAGVGRFLFGIDYSKMLRHSSKAPWLFRNPGAVDQLLAFSKIMSLKVYRRRAPDKKASTDLFVGKISTNITEKQGPSEVIAFSADDNFRDFKATAMSKQNERGTGRSRAVGSVKEIRLANASSAIRTFVGTDTSANDIKGGVYQYGVEVSVSDPTVKLLQQKRKDLIRAIRTIKDYYRLSQVGNIKKNYNIRTRQFTNELAHNIGVKQIVRAIEIYVGILKMLTIQEPSFSKSLTIDLYKLVCPMNGTPENIIKLVELMDLLMRKLEQLSEVGSLNKSPKRTSSGGQSPPKQKKESRIVSKKYIKWFDNLFDNTTPREIGYHYISAVRPTYTGPLMIKWRDYEKIVVNQTRKLFGNLTSFRINKNLKCEVGPTMHSFLSPSQIALGGTELYDFSSDKDPDFYDVNKYNHVLCEIIKLNSGELNIGQDLLYKKNTKIEKYEQKLKDSLVEFLANKGCTIDNINSFFHKTDNKNDKTKATTLVVDKNDLSNVTAQSTMVEQRQTEHKLYENDEVMPNCVLTKIVENYFSHNGPVTPERYDANFIKNFSREVLNQDTVDNLPNQIKGLLLLYSNKENKINIDLSQLSGDDREKFGFLYMNFMNIMEVEVLTGFKNNNIMNPVFQKIKANSLPRGYIFARLNEYRNEQFNLSTYKHNFPIYHKNFIIDNSTGAAETPEAGRREARERISLQTSIPENMILSEIRRDDNLKIIKEMVNSENLSTYKSTSTSQRTSRTAGAAGSPRSRGKAARAATVASRRNNKKRSTTNTASRTSTAGGGGGMTGGGEYA